jgi:hypothetical protein
MHPLIAAIVHVVATPPGAAVAHPDPHAPFHIRHGQVMLEGQPPTGANAIDLIGPAAERLKELSHESVRKHAPGKDPLGLDLRALTTPEAGTEDRALTRAVLADLVKSDLPRLTAEIAAAPRSVRPMGEGPLINTILPSLGDARKLARFQSGRMALALEAGDWETWLTVFSETLRLGQHMAHGSETITAMVAVAVQAMAFDSAQQLIASGRASTIHDRVSEAILAHPLHGLDKALRGERILAEDTLDFVYASGPAGAVYLRQLSANPLEAKLPPRPAKPVVPAGQALGPGMPARAEHEKLIADAYETLMKHARLTTAERAADTAGHRIITTSREGSLILGLLLNPGLKAASSYDQYLADRIGLLTLIALERWRSSPKGGGSYPEALTEVVPTYLRERPGDPYTGKGLGYLPPSRGPYDGGRAFVLYAAGKDAKDDGGKVNFADAHRPLVKGGPHDLLLNRYPPAQGKAQP